MQKGNTDIKKTFTFSYYSNYSCKKYDVKKGIANLETKCK